MGLPMLKNFLGCMTVRTGTLILGWMSLIHSIFYLIWIFGQGIINYLFLSEKAKQDVVLWMDPSRKHQDIYDPNKKVEDYEAVAKVLTIVICIVSIIAVVKLVIDLLFVIGVHKKKPGFMFPSILLQAFGCVICLTLVGLSIILSFTVTIQTVFSGARKGVVAVILYTVITCLCTMVVCYCYLTVYTHYRAIKKEKMAAQPVIYTKM